MEFKDFKKYELGPLHNEAGEVYGIAYDINTPEKVKMYIDKHYRENGGIYNQKRYCSSEQYHKIKFCG